MYFVQARQTGRSLNCFMFPGVGFVEDLEIEVLVCHSRDGADIIPWKQEILLDDIYQIHNPERIFTWAVQNQGVGIVEQMTLDALRKAQVPDILFKQYKASEGGSLLDAMQESQRDHYTYRLIVQEGSGQFIEEETCRAPFPVLDFPGSFSAVQFFHIPQRMDFLVRTYLEKALRGQLYKHHPSIYKVRDISEVLNPSWQEDIDYVNVVADIEGFVHGLSGYAACEQYHNTDMPPILLELTRLEVDVFFRHGMILDTGFYRVHTEDQDITYLTQQLILEPCMQCNHSYRQGRYPRKNYAQTKGVLVQPQDDNNPEQ